MAMVGLGISRSSREASAERRRLDTAGATGVAVLAVPAGAEAAASAGQDHATDLGIGGDRLQRGEQRAHDLRIEGVQAVRSIQGEQGDATYRFAQDCVAHAAPFDCVQHI
jgi:hypothetical protein